MRSASWPGLWGRPTGQAARNWSRRWRQPKPSLCRGSPWTWVPTTTCSPHGTSSACSPCGAAGAPGSLGGPWERALAAPHADLHLRRDAHECAGHGPESVLSVLEEGPAGARILALPLRHRHSAERPAPLITAGSGLGLGGPKDGRPTPTLRPSANPREATARITCWKEPGGSSERPEGVIDRGGRRAMRVRSYPLGIIGPGGARGARSAASAFLASRVGRGPVILEAASANSRAERSARRVRDV